MEGFELIALGVGDAFSARYYSTCFLLGAEGRWLLVDCPHPIRKILRESGRAAGVEVDLGDLEATVLTHLHADHASGVEGLGYASFFALGRRARLLALPEVLDEVWGGHLRAGMHQLLPPGVGGGVGEGEVPAPRAQGFEDYFEGQALDPEGVVEVGPFRIESRRTLHHVPTAALRVTAAGRTLGLSADTAYDPGLIEWLGEADLVVHETNLGAHTPYEKLAALPADLRARMRLVHYTDEFDTEASVIEPLRQGGRYRV